MKDPYTTWSGVVTAVVALVALFGFNLDTKYVTAIIAVGGGIVGFFAKQSD
jgi:hypothetical protein